MNIFNLFNEYYCFRVQIYEIFLKQRIFLQKYLYKTELNRLRNNKINTTEQMEHVILLDYCKFFPKIFLN